MGTGKLIHHHQQYVFGGLFHRRFSPSLGLPRWDSCILRPFHMGDRARRMAGQYLLMAHDSANIVFFPV